MQITRRISLPVLLTMLCAVPAAAHGAPKPDLEVRAVAEPVPTGQAGSYGFDLRATIANDGRGDARASVMRFALSKNTRMGEADTLLPRERTDALDPGQRDTISQEWQVPDTLEPGIYHVIACADAGDRVAEREEKDNCTVADRTVAVTEPRGDTTAQAGAPMPGAAAAGPPKAEHRPEDYGGFPLFDMSVGAPIDCPASVHRQNGRCVWVTTERMRWDRADPEKGRIRSDFWYCPDGYGYPFEVAVGFDPMWQFTGYSSDAFVETVAHNKWTLYRNWLGREYYPSFGAPSESRGYLSIDFNGAARRITATPWEHHVTFLCADKRASSML